ncbi:MAG TPA: hypothetical protein EYQ73_07700 [Candidatus Poseidoniales archaeon]|nr:MAG: hypothetical protein CXT71_07480 [Euryarchaeota archaeon]HIF46655.1 hypothetical protein [Candidatus Poseidoniales archaeon]HIL64624.1 hypothetical protein [Candidatus Poseidoniales archaeon]
MKSRTALIALVLTALMLIPTSLAQAPSPQADETVEKTDLSVDVDQVNGTIEIMMGASKMQLRHGTDSNPGPITLRTTQVVHLGVADVQIEGKMGSKRVGIPAATMFYQQMNGIAEYVDMNDDGLLNVVSNGNAGDFDELLKAKKHHEPVLKWIDFKDVSWQVSTMDSSCEGKNCSLVFSLSSTNLTYGGHGQNESLESITFIFRLTTQEKNVVLESVPLYEVRANAAEEIVESRDKTPLTIDVTGLNSIWKYDMEIEGWDVATDENGSELNDTRLMAFVEFGHASYIKDKVAKWAEKQFKEMPAPKVITGEFTPGSGPTHDDFGNPLKCGVGYEMRGHGKMDDKMKEYHNTNCVEEGKVIDDNRVHNSTVLRSGALHFDEDGQRMGSIRWVSNATVDGNETEVLFQIHGYRPILAKDILNEPLGHYRGARLVAGYNIEIGDSIVHDPEFETDVVDMETMSYDTIIVDQAGKVNLKRIVLLASGFAFLVLASSVLIVRSKAAGRSKQAPMPKPQEWAGATTWTQSTDWQTPPPK